MNNLLNLRNGYGAFFSIGVVVFLIGVFVFFQSVCSPLYNYSRTFFWDKVPAVLLEKEMVKMATVRDSRRNRFSGYRAEVTYEYEYNGETYISDSVSNYDVDWAKGQNWLDRELDFNTLSFEKVNVWVNPSKPGESYLIRFIWKGALFLGTLMALVFAIVGYALMRFSCQKNE